MDLDYSDIEYSNDSETNHQLSNDMEEMDNVDDLDDDSVDDDDQDVEVVDMIMAARLEVMLQLDLKNQKMYQLGKSFGESSVMLIN